MNKKVFILSGPPASGKSTWVRKHLTPGSEWISRDNVRFSIVSEDENYFSHEDEVFDTFINYINQVLDDENIHTIFVDATHLNKRSRSNILNRIKHRNIAELNCVCFITPLDVCLNRNNKRVEREKVPEESIKKMYQSFQIPSADENFNYLYIVDENGNMKEGEF